LRAEVSSPNFKLLPRLLHDECAALGMERVAFGLALRGSLIGSEQKTLTSSGNANTLASLQNVS
jgi:hypothetical protein